VELEKKTFPEPLHYQYWPKGVPYMVNLPRTTLDYNLEVSAARYPQKTAISYYGSPISYARLKSEVDALAGYLQQKCGVKKGDRVLLYMQNSPQFIIAYYAILRADAVIVPANPMNLTEEMRHYIEDSGALVAICANDLFSRLQPLMGPGGARTGNCRRLWRICHRIHRYPHSGFYPLSRT
jgi:fatty-acyl-CoA synthase